MPLSKRQKHHDQGKGISQDKFLRYQLQVSDSQDGIKLSVFFFQEGARRDATDLQTKVRGGSRSGHHSLAIMATIH